MKSIILLALFNFCLCSSQVKTIEYKAIAVDTIMKDIPDLFKGDILKNNKDVSKVTYTLQFDENNMKFFANKPSELSNDDYDMTLIMADIVGTTYRKSNSSEVFDERESFGSFKNFIATSKLITNWNITNETKIINGYNCIKATTILNIDYGDNEVSKLYPITAWFCPDIKYSYGPRGIGGLPGLILELNQSIVTFYASKIDFVDKKIDISMPTNKKIISTSKMYDDFEKQ
jgi:GLPGLI family protein